jgi:YidC/Oxa1 family membrane protein insertase
MISNFFTIVFYQPLYNGLIFLFNIIPWANAGLVVILFTIFVKLVIFPLSIKATYAQMEMKEIEKDLKAIKEKYKDNKEQQTLKTVELYKEKNINPFAGFVVLIVQLPIIIALYRIFLKSGLPVINTAMLYSFVHVPAYINMAFFYISDVSGKSVSLAILAGISTYFQIKYSAPPVEPNVPGEKNMQADVMRMLQTQMKYFFPILVFFISWSVSAAVSLYWVTSNVFTIGQELYMRKYIRKVQ